MANKAFFTGEHSTVLINLNNVLFAMSEGPSGGKLTVYFRDGHKLILNEGNADMFRKQWRSFNEDN